MADVLAEQGVEHIFSITGGGAMHLNDAIGRHPRLSPIYCHHEQACAIAGESYGRLTNRLAAICVTTGPGGINALNGVFGAHVDSIGLIVVSGQVKRETQVSSTRLALRQLGDQEVDIVAMARPITKWATTLDDPAKAQEIIEQAIWLARNGRPGPVWVDIPLDVQGAPVSGPMSRFNPDEEARMSGSAPLRGKELEIRLRDAIERLEKSERPIVMVGAGVRISGMHSEFLSLIDRLKIPVATCWNAHDAVPNDHLLFVGRPGTIGDRPGNFAVQNSDFVLILGSRLNIRQISYNWPLFAPNAYKVMIDIDEAELEKPTLSIDAPIHADLRDAIPMLGRLPYQQPARHDGFLKWCKERQARYPVQVAASPGPEGLINPYAFVTALFDQLDRDDVVVTGDGTACVVTFQVAVIKSGQRLYTNSGCASMGYELPAAVGAAIAEPNRRVVCIAGDGSIMLNLQELQTIAGRDLPVKLVILNNNGYSSIRQTQRNYFPDGITGCDPQSGVSFPNFVDVVNSFGIEARRCDDPENVVEAIKMLLSSEGPQALEVLVDPDQPFAPRVASRRLEDGTMVSAPLEDMAPFLPREELADNMIGGPTDPL